MVGDQAKKGNKSSISVSNSVNQVKAASAAPPPYRFSPWSTDQKKEKYRAPWLPPPCARLEEIKGICKKLSGFCDGNLQIVLGMMNGTNTPPAVSTLSCDGKNERCSKDVLLKLCPIRAMYECAPKYDSCGKENCKEFDKMTVCPFADKQNTARCDYWYRLWKSSAKNKNPYKNLKDAVCGDENYANKGAKTTRQLPASVKDCCNSVPVPDESGIKLSCRPIYNPGYKINIDSFGFGVRFYNEGTKGGKNMTEKDKEDNYKSQTRGQHLGVDIHCKGLIYSVADGIIVDSRKYGGGGWMIQIKHPVEMTGGEMEYCSCYMHMSYPPEYNQNYYKGQLIGLRPDNKTIIKAPFAGRFVYRAKCKDSGIWGADRVYDMVFADQGTPALTGGGHASPLVLPLDEPIELCPVGESLNNNPFASYKMQNYEGKKNGGAISGTLYFARMWIPYTKGVDPTAVKAGQPIGLESNTGLYSVPKMGAEHLHFELTKEVERKTYYNCYNVFNADIPDPPRYPE